MKYTVTRAIRRNLQKFRRIERLVGKKPSELDGNKRRTLRMALRNGWLKIDEFTGVIQKRGNMDREKIELAAIKTLRFCRKHKQDYHNYGYPEKFVGEIEALEAVYPNIPPHWVIQRGSLKNPELRQIFESPDLVDEVLQYYA